jgi:hypothetical protein
VQREKTMVRGMMVRGMEKRQCLAFIPRTIIPLTNFLQMNDFEQLHCKGQVDLANPGHQTVSVDLVRISVFG